MKIAVFAGPTGGHFFPALAFVEAFKSSHPDAKILFVTGERGKFLATRFLRGDIQCEYLCDFPFPRPQGFNFVVEFFQFLVKLARAFQQSGKLISRFQPDLCVGFGSYVAFPGIWIGRKKKIKTLIHEQNQRVGRANAWLCRFADRIAVSFKDTEVVSRKGPNLLWTGLPVRSSLLEGVLKKRSLSDSPPSKFTLLIVGGSQGASSLNRLWAEAIHSMSREELSKIAVIHITGNKDYEGIKEMYLTKAMEARALPFYEKIEEFYAQAHLAIARAGASTLFELALFELPAIIFPYQHADAHQELNARSFEKEGAIVFLSEKSCTGPLLKQRVFQILESPLIRNRMAESLRRLARPDAAEKLVSMAEELVSRQVCLT